MGYKDKEQQREYQRQWIANRRTRFFAGKFCARCGSTNRLELDHKDPAQKVDHKVWSWSEARRNVEVAKCQILCNTCHKIKSGMEYPKGMGHHSRKWTDKQVQQARRLRLSGKRCTEIGILLGIPASSIADMTNGQTWSSLD